MNSIVLAGAWEKARRARSHLEALRIATDTEREQNRVPLRAEPDSSEGYFVLRIAEEPKLPLLQWGVITGDVVHNLRSALDHLFWRVAHHEGRNPGNPAAVQFPIMEKGPSSAYWERSFVSAIDPSHAQRLERHQPYNPFQGPDNYSGPYVHPLALLKELSNDDKHRVVTPILALSQSYRLFTGPAFPEGVELAGFPADSQDEGGFELGAPVMRVVAPRFDSRVKVVGDVAPGVLISKRRGLIPSLERIDLYVERILGEFGPLL
jgi:hypothetical protein